MARFSLICLLLFAGVIASYPVLGQTQTTTNNLVFEGADTLNSVLAKSGTRVVGDNVVAFFPKDSLFAADMQRIVDTLSAGVKAIEVIVGAPLVWMVHQPSTTYTFYFRPDNFISHVSMNATISIPFWRIKTGKSPWLHELVHEMLNTKAGNWVRSGMSEEEANKRYPGWLIEGLADYLSLQIAMQKHWPHYDVFSSSFTTNVDSLFQHDLTTDKAKKVLAFIGKNGAMPELLTNDRMQYAPAFYHGSYSFVAYLVKQYGLVMLLNGIAAFGQEQQTIERQIGKSMEIVNKEWLKTLERNN